MTEEDRRDSEPPEEASSGAGSEEREQMLDRSSMESALAALSPGPPAGGSGSRRQPPDASRSGSPEEAPVRLSMQDIERLAVKPPDRPSSVPPAGQPEDGSAQIQEAKASRADAASLGNTMKALFDSSIAAEPASNAEGAEPTPDVDEVEQASDAGIASTDSTGLPTAPSAADEQAPRASGAQDASPLPTPSVEGEPAEEKQAVADRRESPQADKPPVAVGSEGAAPAASAGLSAREKAAWTAVLLVLSAAAVVGIALGGWPLLRPSDRDEEPVARTGSLSPSLSVSGPAEEDEASGGVVDTGEQGARESRRRKRPRAERSARRQRNRRVVEAEEAKRSERGAAERTIGIGPGAAAEPAGTPGPESEETAESTASGPEPAGVSRAGAAWGAAVEPEGGEGAEAKAERGSEPLSEVPSRESVKQAMERVLPEIRACAGGKHGMAEVVMTVKNTGRVIHAVVGGDFAGTAEGSCIARAVRRTRMPSFLRPSFTLVYPFSL